MTLTLSTKEGLLTPEDRRRVLVELRRFKGRDARSFRQKMDALAMIAKDKKAPASKRREVLRMLGHWQAELSSKQKEQRRVVAAVERPMPHVVEDRFISSAPKEADDLAEQAPVLPSERREPVLSCAVAVSAFLPLDITQKLSRLESKQDGRRYQLEQDEQGEWAAIMHHAEAKMEAIGFCAELRAMERALRRVEECAQRCQGRREQLRSWVSTGGQWVSAKKAESPADINAGDQTLVEWKQKLAEMKTRLTRAQGDFKDLDRPIQEAVKRVVFTAQKSDGFRPVR